MENNKPLLVDVMPFDVTPELIFESAAKNNGKLLVRGIIQRANSLNENKRRYPKNLLEREVNKYMRLIEERRSLGELDHPDSSVVNLQNVSHLISEVQWDGDDLWGTVEVLTTPSGNILKALFESGVKIGISSRGLGSTRDIGEGAVEVQDDYEILCWDMVSNPSTQGGFMNRLNESANGAAVNLVSGKYEKINKIVMDILSSMSENI